VRAATDDSVLLEVDGEWRIDSKVYFRRGRRRCAASRCGTLRT
jgi:hypothetical protein